MAELENERENFSFRLYLWRRFRRDWAAMTGLAMVSFLFAVALFAPFLANGRPLLAIAANGEVTMPFLRFLFAPDTSEKLIEQLFNYVLLLLIFAVILRIFRPRIRKWLLPGAALLLLIPFLFVQNRMDKTDYRAIAANARWTLFAPIPYGPFEQVGDPYETPSRNHWLGTDDIGRSVASRMIYGARVSLAVGLLSSAIALLIGTMVGLLIGYFGGLWDLVVMRLLEIILCFPTFLLLLILMSMFKDRKFEQSILIVILVIGLSSWVGLTQLVRGEVLKQRALPYIQSCRATGISSLHTMIFHLLPNISGPILITFSFGVAGAILAESGLSFLGFGVQTPTASWGTLLRQSFEDPLNYWNLTLFPGIALFCSVCGFNFIGEGLQKALDPKK